MIARDIYAGKISSELSVSKDVLLSQISVYDKRKKRNLNRNRFNEIQKKTSGVSDKVNTQKSKYTRCANAEEALISSLLRNPDFWGKIKNEITADDFLTDFNKKLFILIAERLSAGQSTDLSSLSNSELTLEEMGALKAIELKSETLSHSIDECRTYINVIKQEKEKAKRLSVDVSQISAEEFLNLFKNT